jgi:hypothetical protein
LVDYARQFLKPDIQLSLQVPDFRKFAGKRGFKPTWDQAYNAIRTAQKERNRLQRL